MTQEDCAQLELLSVDQRSLVSQADLAYDGGIERPEAGIPIGNGTVGSLVWTESSRLKFQLNRVDVYANDSETMSFPQRNQDYGYGCGFVEVDVGGSSGSAFCPDETTAELAVFDGTATVSSPGVETRSRAWQAQDVLAVDVTDNRSDPAPITIHARSLRPAVVETKHHSATTTCHAGSDRIAVTQTFEEEAYYCQSALVVGIVGREGTTDRPTDTEARIRTKPREGTVSIFIATAASFDRDTDVQARAAERLDAAMAAGIEGILADNDEWWEQFWSRSLVQLSSPDGVAAEVQANYTYFLYLMASSSRGPYPPNFGGMLWTTDGDFRRWGVQQWWTNLSLYYRGLFPVNRDELLEPLFSMYSGMRESCELAARQQWGSEGIYLPETTWFDGLGELPADIAAEMRALYLRKQPWETRSPRFRSYAATKHPHTSRWNWKAPGQYEAGQWTFTDKGAGPFSDVNHFFASGPELATLYWKRYAYTGDTAWLRDCGYPMIRGITEFFRHYPHLKADAEGAVHLHHGNHSEPVYGAKDPFDAFVGLHGLLPIAIAAAEALDIDPELRTAWQELHEQLAPLPTTAHPDALDEGLDTPRPLWASGLYPAAKVPDGDLRDQFDVRCRYYDFDIATLESKAQAGYRDRYELAEATYAHRYPDGIDETTNVPVMSSVGTIAARLGHAEDVKHALRNQLAVLAPAADFVEYEQTGEPAVLPNRLTLREGQQALSAQRLGNVTYALHEALLQSVPPAPGEQSVTRVFPAWPAGWDAQFILRTRGNFLVGSSISDGEVRFVEVAARNGGPFRIRNPWPDRAVRVVRNGEFTARVDDSPVVVSTAEGDRIVLLPAGTTVTEREPVETVA